MSGIMLIPPTTLWCFLNGGLFVAEGARIRADKSPVKDGG